MVGDGDVLQPRSAGGAGHALDGLLAVGGGGVHVQVAAQVAACDQLGERPPRGRVDFAAVLAHLRWDQVEVQCSVDLRLRGAGERGTRRHVEDAVLVQA